MNQKNNQRFQETDRRIRDCFLSALSEKELSEITVQEICAQAGINRSSFYLHYKDVYDVLDAMSYEAGKTVMEDIAKADVQSPYFFSEEYVLVILRHVRENAVFYRAYLSGVGMADIEKGYRTLFETVFKPYFRQLGIESEHRMEYYFAFVKSGFLAVVRQWLDYGCAETPGELADIIMQSLPVIPENLPVPQYDNW
ncbi:MAG: TetR/AcrR family transcriptional regulator C-terminal domain-containing protein [Hominenteromicrobium sp.]